MDLNIFQRIQVGLDEKRHTLTEFLETVSEIEKETSLCRDETCIQYHLQVIETSLGQIETNTPGLCEVCHGTVDTALLEMDYSAHVCLDHYSEHERRRSEKTISWLTCTAPAIGLDEQYSPKTGSVNLQAVKFSYCTLTA